ncbi:hypothetical protein Tco_1508504 [Tanacetum coccineum]
MVLIISLKRNGNCLILISNVMKSFAAKDLDQNNGSSRVTHLDVGKRNRKTVALEKINSIEKMIDEGSAMPSDNDHRPILFQEIEKIDKFASMDIIQKAHVKWDIEGLKIQFFWAHQHNMAGIR